MRKNLVCIVLIAISMQAFTQSTSKIFSSVKEITVRSIGTIQNGDHISGYYAFYEYDKASRKSIIYKLDILDENLNILGTKEIEGSKQLHILNSGYDGKNFCFRFWDDNANVIDIKVYNQEAQEVVSNSEKTKYDPTNTGSGFYQMTQPGLNITDNNGFVSYSFNNKIDAFNTNYVEGTQKTSWSRPYEPQGSFKMSIPTFIGNNNEVILTAISSIEKGMFNTKGHNSILATNTKDGSKLFEISTDINDAHVVPINALFDNDKITIVGLNYETEKSLTTAPDGLAFIQLDKTGKILSSNIKSFEKLLSKQIHLENHKLRNEYNLFIHDIVNTNNNTFLVIAEEFKMQKSTILLGNMLLMEFSKNNEIVQAKEITKDPGFVANYAPLPFLGAYLSAFIANSHGLMDYRQMLKNHDGSEITFNFFEYYDQLYKGAKKLKNYGQIKYKAGKITVDKVPVKSQNNEDADFTSLYPAKPGFVLEMNYYKKKKELTMDFIKLNN